jgi:hypothetical protein
VKSEDSIKQEEPKESSSNLTGAILSSLDFQEIGRGCKIRYSKNILLIWIICFVFVYAIYEKYQILVLENEPDPLTITATENNQDIVTCKDRVFTFERHVVNTKFIRVYVEPRMKDLKTGVVYVLEGKTYEGPPQDNIVTYRIVVPPNFAKGLYEYTPTLTYDINPRKTITKVAPSQKVLLRCDSHPDSEYREN